MNLFVLELVNKVDRLKPIYEKHINDNDELLCHVFFGDLTRYVIELNKSIMNNLIDSDVEAMGVILNHLENKVTGLDDNIDNLIGVSFLENLIPLNDEIWHLESMFGQNLKTEFRKMLVLMGYNIK